MIVAIGLKQIILRFNNIKSFNILWCRFWILINVCIEICIIIINSSIKWKQK
jgi:hypothetical protein